MRASQNNELPQANLAAAYARERHEARYQTAIAIEISGISKQRHVFHEMTSTKDISEWGCCFELSVGLRPNDMFLLRVMGGGPPEEADKRRSLFQVLRAEKTGRGWLIAAWKLEDRNLWGDAIRNGAPDRGTRESRKHMAAKRRGRRRRTKTDGIA